MAVRGRERTAWQDIYAIQQTSNLDDVGSFDEDADIGILGDGSTAGSGFFLMKLTDHPHLTPANQSLEQELTAGIAQRREDEFNQVASDLASVTLNMQMHAWNLSMFTRGLLQDGSREWAGTAASTDPPEDLINQVNMPYWIPDVTDYMAVVRALDSKGPASGKYPHESYINPLGNTLSPAQTDVDFTSHYMMGIIPRSIAITAEEGNIIQMAVDCAGAYAGICNIAGKMDSRWHTTRRLRVYPTPRQLGLSAGDLTSDIQVWIGGTAVTTTTGVATREDFSAGGGAAGGGPASGTVEIAVDTGELNFNDLDASGGHGQYVQHNAYRRSTGFEYRHPFELLPDLKPPLLWQNAQVKMRRMDMFGAHNLGANDWVDVKLPGFTLTMNNNLVGHFYNNPVPYKYLLGRFTQEGTVTVPWGTDKADLQTLVPAVTRPSFGGNNPLVDFLDGVPNRLRIMWGQTNHTDAASGAATGYAGGDYDDDGYHTVDAARDGAVAIDLAIRHTDQNVEGENELGQVMSFTLVDDLGDQGGPVGGGAGVQPDLDRTIALRMSIGYQQAALDRGQATPLEYPEATAPT